MSIVRNRNPGDRAVDAKSNKGLRKIADALPKQVGDDKPRALQQFDPERYRLHDRAYDFTIARNASATLN